MKVTLFIERADDGGWWSSMTETIEKCGFHGAGKTPQEAIDDLWFGYREARADYRPTLPAVEELEVSYQYDINGFLHHYKNLLTQSGLSRLTGINSKQISHYLTGYRNPSAKTVKKIEDAVHAFADELRNVQLVTVKANGDVVE